MTTAEPGNTVLRRSFSFDGFRRLVLNARRLCSGVLFNMTKPEPTDFGIDSELVVGTAVQYRTNQERPTGLAFYLSFGSSVLLLVLGCRWARSLYSLFCLQDIDTLIYVQLHIWILREHRLSDNLKRYKLSRARFSEWREARQLAHWYRLSPFKFEEEVATLLTNLGHKATTTRSTGDSDVDIEITTIEVCRLCSSSVRPTNNQLGHSLCDISME
jgi:hypothetical protein